MIDKITGKTKVLEKALDAAWLRNEVISNNIANVNTPGFKKSYVRFEEYLSDSISELQLSGIKKSDKFIPIGHGSQDIPEPSVEQESFTSTKRDKNNVDIDVEMAELAKNTIKYNAVIAQLTKEFSKIKLVLNSGR